MEVLQEKCIKIIKKDGTLEDFNFDKIKNAIAKSGARVMVSFSDQDLELIYQIISRDIELLNIDTIDIKQMHNIVEVALERVNPAVAKAYKDYRNYKQDFVHMLDKVYQESQRIMYLGDRENSNVDSTMVSTKRTLVCNELFKEMYKKFFLTKEELEAFRDGYIWIHDANARLNCMNCCLFDMKNVLKGGFEMGNIQYTEPKTLDVAFDVIGDIILNASSNQYGGLTVPEIDDILAPYAEKSYNKYLQKYLALGITKEKAENQSLKDVERDFEQGWQAIELKLNTVASSRGDTPFVSVSAGLSKNKFGIMSNKIMFKTRKNGQGVEGFKKPVLFPKLIFLYDKNLHSEGKELREVYNAGIECSMKAMYPDWLSLTSDSGYIPSMYKKYGKVVSLMGCRASLSPWYERGGIEPADENDVPIFTGRFNIGAVTLHLPMILAKSRQENKDFYEVLDYYMEMIRQLHIRTYDYLGELKASTNPLGFTQGGFYGGNLNYDDKIKPLLKSATASFGITALNELQKLYNKKSLIEDNSFALEVMEYINKKVAEYKKEDGWLYAIYGTPAENLCYQQIKQFRQKYGIIEGVSDRLYTSNSFHCHVSEDITPIEKQDYEKEFWDLFNGGKIQYVRYPISYNKKAVEDLIDRAMDIGFYEGVNMSLSYCNKCGHEELEMDICPKCGSKDLTKIDRMVGYLSYSRVKGQTRLNDGKMAEIADRKSM